MYEHGGPTPGGGDGGTVASNITGARPPTTSPPPVVQEPVQPQAYDWTVFYCHCGEDEPPFAPFTEEDAKSVPMNTTNACRGVLQDINRQSPKCSGCSADMKIFFLLTSHGMVWLDTGR